MLLYQFSKPCTHYSCKTKSLLHSEPKCPLNHKAPFLHSASAMCVFSEQGSLQKKSPHVTRFYSECCLNIRGSTHTRSRTSTSTHTPLSCTCRCSVSQSSRRSLSFRECSFAVPSGAFKQFFTNMTCVKTEWPRPVNPNHTTLSSISAAQNANPLFFRLILRLLLDCLRFLTAGSFY